MVKKINLYFILHVCRIHNSNFSEENIFLSVQNYTGIQLTRQLRLCYNCVLLASWEVHSFKLLLGNIKWSLP